MILQEPEATVFLAGVRRNLVVAALLDRLSGLALPDCWLVAGCLFETIWNGHAGNAPTAHISDYDVFYFDAADLSYEAEDAVIKRVLTAFADLDAVIEVKNQARVHLWYREKFGQDYPALKSSTEGIDRFLVACTCIGVRCVVGQPPAVYATHGLADMSAGILRPNAGGLVRPERFLEKAEKYRARWPWLQIVQS